MFFLYNISFKWQYNHQKTANFDVKKLIEKEKEKNKNEKK